MKIVKNTVGANGTFGFTVTNATPVSPSIATVANTGEQVLGGLVLGSVVNVTETPQANWTLNTTVCTNARAGSGPFTLGTTALAPGDDVTCTFTNTATAPQMKIVKSTVGADGTFDFTVTNATPATPSIATAGNTGQQVLGGLVIGAIVNVIETPQANWTLNTAVCTNARAGSGPFTLGTTALAPGDDVTCTFTNAATAPQMKIVKNTVGADGTFNFTVTNATPLSPSIATAGNTGQQVLGGLVLGSVVNVTETPQANWTLNTTVCTNARAGSGPFTLGTTALAPGDDVTCTFTNTATAPQMKIVKNTVGGDGTFDFTVTNATPATPSIATAGNTGQQVLGGLVIGAIVNATETPQAEWSLNNTSCVNARPDSGPFNLGTSALAPGDDVTCTFTNLKVVITTLTKSFSPDTFSVGGTTTLTFTVTNPTGGLAHNDIGFVDNLPANLQVAPGPVIGGTCTNAAAATSAPANGGTITVANLQVPAGPSSCTVTVAVTNKPFETNPSCTGSPAEFTNGSGNVASVTNVDNQVSNSCVTVTPLSPTVTKSFSPNTFVVGGTTTLTFTVSNPANNPALSNINIVDQLPLGLQVAATPAIGGSCVNAAAATSAPANGGTITIANLQVPAGSSSCTVTVAVTNVPRQVNLSCDSSPALFTNAAGNLTVSNVTNGVLASCVTVTPKLPTLTKSFAPPTFPVGGTTTLTFTVTNPAENPALSNVGFVDTLPAGLQVAPGPVIGGTCTNAAAATSAPAGGTSISVANLQVPAGTAAPPADGSCTVTVAVTNKPGQVNASCDATPPEFTNSPASITSVSNVANGVVNSCVTVTPLPPVLAKSFSPNTFSVGGTTTLTFTVTNPLGNPALSNVGFVDTLPSGLQVAPGPVIGGTCTNAAAATSAPADGGTVTVVGLAVPTAALADSSCTVTVAITNKNGQVNPTCDAVPAAFTNKSTNVTVTNVTNGISDSCVTVTPLSPTLNKAFLPLTFEVGGTTTLTFTVTNPAGNPAVADVNFVDTLPHGLKVAATPAIGGSCANAVAATTAPADAAVVRVEICRYLPDPASARSPSTSPTRPSRSTRVATACRRSSPTPPATSRSRT